MTTNKSNKGEQRMQTLEKIWENKTEEDNDVDSMEIEDEKSIKSTNNKKNEAKKKKNNNADNETLYRDSKEETTPLFPMTIRFKIIANNEKTARTKHIAVLNTIKNEMDHFELFKTNNYKTDINNIEKDDFQFNSIGKKTKGFIVVHRIILNTKYYNIKNNNTIIESLKDNDCHIYQHMWTTDEWDIVNLGFLSGVSPKHQAKDTVQHKINLATNQPVDYQLKATNVKITHQGHTMTAFAYEVFCKKQEVKEVCDTIVESADFTNYTLIKQQWKYTNPSIYIDGINKQNEFVNNISTIPIYGITTDAMSYIYNSIVSNKNVLEVGRTGTTKELGRWNVYTTKTTFQTTTKWLQDNLDEIYDDKCPLDSDDIPPNFKPEVRFGTTISFQKKTDPLIAITEKSLEKFFEDPNHHRSWASVASANTTPSTITPNSNMNITIQKLTESIQKLCNRLDNIERTLKEHHSMIQTIQQSNDECKENMEKLGTTILELEESAARMTPRRLADSYNNYTSNKRQNTQNSPKKGYNT